MWYRSKCAIYSHLQSAAAPTACQTVPCTGNRCPHQNSAIRRAGNVPKLLITKAYTRLASCFHDVVVELDALGFLENVFDGYSHDVR
jgi:hypothetical protein